MPNGENTAADPDVPTPLNHCYRCPRPTGDPCPQTAVQGCAYLAPSADPFDRPRAPHDPELEDKVARYRESLMSGYDPLADAGAEGIHPAWYTPDHPDAPRYVHAEIGEALDPSDPASYQQPREQVLTTAASLICGDRQASYGDATESFARLARLWTEVLGTAVTPEQVALCLVQLKVSRLVVSPTHEDSWVDIAGYAALGGEIAQRTRTTTTTEESDNAGR